MASYYFIVEGGGAGNPQQLSSRVPPDQLPTLPRVARSMQITCSFFVLIPRIRIVIATSTPWPRPRNPSTRPHSPLCRPRPPSRARRRQTHRLVATCSPWSSPARPPPLPPPLVGVLLLLPSWRPPFWREAQQNPGSRPAPSAGCSSRRGRPASPSPSTRPSASSG